MITPGLTPAAIPLLAPVACKRHNFSYTYPVHTE